MDGSHFDTLARAIAQGGTRRRLVSLLLALPLGGVLTPLGEEEAAAQQSPIDRVRQRTPQRNRKQRNTKKNNNNQNNNNNKKNNNNNNNAGGGGGPLTTGPSCLPFEANCQHNSECCSGSCTAGAINNCLCSRSGFTCQTSRDCCTNPPGLSCVNFVCQ
jgi:hypothetical protein